MLLLVGRECDLTNPIAMFLHDEGPGVDRMRFKPHTAKA
jgi:hypothetical protein